MTKTFACPFCSNEYVVLPTLAGRRVRCTACKNVFILGYDGVAQKVAGAEGVGGVGAVAAAGAESSALEAKQQSEAGANQQASMSKPAVRSHTRVIKKNTERIQKIRTSLQEAAQKAAQGVQQAPSGRQASAAKQSPSSASRTFSRARPVQQPSGSGRWVYVLAGMFLLLGIVAWTLLFAGSVQQACLDAFCERLSEDELRGSDRLAAYRKRLCLATRDGYEVLPVLLNVDHAQIAEQQRIEWLQVVAACSEIINGMECNRKFAMWHTRGQAEQIESLWAQYGQKRSMEGFYTLLKKRGPDFIRFSELPRSLALAGLDKQTVYVVSLLLAGTTTAVPGQQYVDFGLRGGDMPTELLIWEFKGEQGNMLVDGGGYYDITVAQSYSGLIAAFNGFTQSPDACMILDIRLRADVSEVYTPSLNPLHTAAYKSIRKLVESEPMPEADGLNLE